MGAMEPAPVQESEKQLDFSSFLNQNVSLVPEKFLRDITRGALQQFVSECQNFQHLLKLWECFLHTFASASLPGSHNTAICNALSSYLESSLKSQNEELREFVLSEETWVSVFETYLDRYPTGRPKPMKQVLTTLVSILSNSMDRTTASSVSRRIASIIVPNIILFEPRSRLKASLVSLEVFIRKGSVDTLVWLKLTQDWLLESHHSWIPLLGEDCSNLGIPLDLLVDVEKRKHISSQDLLLYTARIFCLVLLLNTNIREISLPAELLFSQLCRKLKNLSPASGFPFYQDGSPFWAGPLKYVSLRNLNCLDPVANHVLSPLFQSEPKDFQSFVATLPIESVQSKAYVQASNEEYALLFAILKLGKELKLVHDMEELTASSHEVSEFSILLEAKNYQQFLIHAGPGIRISALSLLVADPATAKPFSASTFEALMGALPYLHAETDSHTRSQLISLLRKLVIRLRGSSGTVHAASDSGAQPETNRDHRPDSRQFILWYISFLESELQPTASYQRHILALKTLTLLLQSGLDRRLDSSHLSKLGQEQQKWRFSIDAFKPSLFRATADLLLDPYEDVRETSMLLLRLFPRDFILNPGDSTNPSPYSQLTDALVRAETIAGYTGRVDHSDAVGHLYRLLFDLSHSDDDQMTTGRTAFHLVDKLLTGLEQSISCSAGSFHATLHNTPLQGHICALRGIVATPYFHKIVSSSEVPIPAWSYFMDRMLSICFQVWFGVQDFLCVDTPEREYENAEEDLAGPKDALSFSWRALSESSLLLNAILTNDSFAPEGSQDGLRYETLLKIGKLSFDQLANLRHRGAFSTVAHTFASCSLRCYESNDPEIHELPEIWYKDAVNIIYDQASRLTRKSAGLPAIITGIVSSQPKSNLFHRIMEELQEIAATSPMDASEKAELELPQVHAMNCLKDIFIANILAPNTEPYVMPTLNISANCLGSKIWAIRNCGLTLLRALITRMSRPTPESRRGVFALPGSDANYSVPFEKHNGLTPLLSRLLSTSGSTTENGDLEVLEGWDLSILTERIFPALELIGKKAPARPSEDNEVLKSLVLSQLSNPVWGIRDHAARSYVTLIKRNDLLQTAQEFIASWTTSKLQNQFHGSLLCLKHLFQKLLDSPSGYWRGNLGTIMQTIESIFDKAYSIHLSPYNQASLFEILASILEAYSKCEADIILVGCRALAEKYSLDQTLCRILASGHASLISRSSSLLIRFLSLDILYMKIFELDCSEEPVQLLEAVSVSDPDAASWVLKRVHSTLRTRLDTQPTVIRLYTSIIKMSQFQSLKTQAMSNLAETLEGLYEQLSKIDSTLNFLKSWAKSTDIFEEELTWDRIRFDASVFLEGCLLPLRIDSVADLSNGTIEKSFQRFVHVLKFALSEETEFTTRYAAAASLKCLILGLRSLEPQFSKSELLVPIHFVLYDMLHDDDDELREYATQISLDLTSSQFSVPVIPLATSLVLAESLSHLFPQLDIVFEGALSRFMDSARNPSPFVSVADRLLALQKQSTILFAEEKQNLYIDEVREIETWSRVLAKLEHKGPPTKLKRVFSLWVHDGLRVLRDVLRSNEAKGLLGWASNPEAFSMAVRLICGAKVILLTNGMGCLEANGISRIQDTLREMAEDDKMSEIYKPWISTVRLPLQHENKAKDFAGLSLPLR